MDGEIGIQKNAGDISLDTGDAITQTREVIGVSLAITSAGAVTMEDTDNDVDTIAAKLTGAVDDISFVYTDGLALGIVDGVICIQTNALDISLDTGDSITQTGQFV